MQFNLSLSASQLFRSVRLFEHLSPEELSAVVRVAQPRRLAAGELLFSKSGPGDGMFIVERGELSVTTEGANGEHLTLAYLGNGAFVGEMSLLDGSPRSASVEAVAASSGFWMSREAFSALRLDCPSAAMKVLWQLAQTLETRRRGALSRLRLQLAQVEGEASLGHEARELLLLLRWV